MTRSLRQSIAAAALRRSDSIFNPITGLGGSDDKGSAGLPVWTPELDTRRLTVLYERNGYAARLVDAHADDGTKEGWRVDDGSAANADPFRVFDRRLRVRERMAQALRTSGKHGGAIVLMVTEEEARGFDDNGRNPEGRHLLELPLNLDSVTALVNLAVFGPEDATADGWVSDIRSVDYRCPEFWLLHAPAESIGSVNAPEPVEVAPGYELKPGQSIRVHHSRVLYVPGKRVSARRRFERGGWDMPVLQAFYDQIRNITSVEQAAAVLVQELKIDVVKVSGLDNKTTEEQCAYFDERMQLFASGKAVGGVAVIDQDEDFQSQTANLSGIGEVHALNRQALCAVSDYPAVVLFGDTPGGLNSDGDSHRTQHQNAVSKVQSSRIDNALTRLYEVAYATGEFGDPPEQWEVEYHPIYKLTRQEQANLEKTHAETDAIRINSDVVFPEHVTDSRFSDEGYQDDIKPVDLAAMKRERDERVAQMQADLDAVRNDPNANRPPDDENDPPAQPPQGDPPEPREDVLEQLQRLDWFAHMNPQMLQMLQVPGVTDFLTHMMGEHPALAAIRKVEEQATREIDRLQAELADVYQRLSEVQSATKPSEERETDEVPEEDRESVPEDDQQP